MEARRHRLLVVDDEVNIADTLRLIFTINGYDARAAYDAQEAIEIVAEWAPDLAIIDVILPLMNGIDLAVLLKTQIPTCRILLFSGQAATVDLLAEARKKGQTFEILAKPVHPTTVLECVLKLMTAAQAPDAPKSVVPLEFSTIDTEEPPQL